MPTAEVWRIRDAASFARLRASGRRARRGPFTVVWLPPSATEIDIPPRVAYAIGRKVGGAVVRNRLRRRLQVVVRGLTLGPGTYLVIASADAVPLPAATLTERLQAAVTAATSERRR